MAVSGAAERSQEQSTIPGVWVNDRAKARFAHPIDNDRERPMRLLTTASFVAALAVFATPAVAQTGAGTTPSPPSATNGTMPNNSGTGVPNTSPSAQPDNPTMGGDTTSSCQGMIDKANAMTQPTDATKAAEVKKHLDLAKAAQTKGDETGCKTHVDQAMRSM
jgi:hypothetical protein